MAVPEESHGRDECVHGGVGLVDASSESKPVMVHEVPVSEVIAREIPIVIGLAYGALIAVVEQKLVRLTLMHPQFAIDYCFPSYEEEWLVKKCSKKSRIMKSTKMIGIDCEMVLCEDGTEALVKGCAIDRNLQVKLDAVANPKKAIADYRTEITGISAPDLDGVTCSLPDVQAKLGYDLRKPGSPRNCLDDAYAAMKLVLARLEGRVDDVISEKVKELDARKKNWLQEGYLFTGFLSMFLAKICGKLFLGTSPFK